MPVYHRHSNYSEKSFLDDLKCNNITVKATMPQMLYMSPERAQNLAKRSLLKSVCLRISMHDKNQKNYRGAQRAIKAALRLGAHSAEHQFYECIIQRQSSKLRITLLIYYGTRAGVGLLSLLFTVAPHKQTTNPIISTAELEIDVPRSNVRDN